MSGFNQWTILVSCVFTAAACSSFGQQPSDAAGDATASGADAANSLGAPVEAFATAEQGLSSYDGCRGTGKYVCDELVDPDYYFNHPTCQRNPTCRTPYWPCDADCPAPTAEETPNIMVTAAGAATETAYLHIGYIYNYTISPGNTSGGLHGNALDGRDIPELFAWERLQRGIGVNAESGRPAQVTCTVGSMGQYRKITSIVVRFKNGDTDDEPCDEELGSCSMSDIPVGTGLVATCNYAAR